MKIQIDDDSGSHRKAHRKPKTWKKKKKKKKKVGEMGLDHARGDVTTTSLGGKGVAKKMDYTDRVVGVEGC